MDIDEVKSHMLALFFEEGGFYATTVTYDGDEVQAIVDIGRMPDEGGGRGMAAAAGRALADRSEVTVLASVVDDPADVYRKAVVIDGDTWRVMAIKRGDLEGTYVLEVAKDERPVM